MPNGMQSRSDVPNSNFVFPVSCFALIGCRQEPGSSDGANKRKKTPLNRERVSGVVYLCNLATPLVYDRMRDIFFSDAVGPR